MKKELIRYQSINKYLYESLIRSELWFSSPLDFNDPFDCDFPLDYPFEVSKLIPKEMLLIDNISSNKRSRLTNDIYSPLKFSQKFYTVKKNIGVCCFSEIKDNLIMWSHYADNHKGVILIFDGKVLNTYFDQIGSVKYTNNIEKLDFNESPLDILKKRLFKKSTHWSAEREIRIVTNKPGYFPFPAGALKEIRFGMKTNGDEMRDIIKLVAKFGYDKTIFTQVKVDSYSYKLTKNKIVLSGKTLVSSPL